MKKTFVPISSRALIQRINRKLKSKGRMGHQMRSTRGDRDRHQLGDYFIIDVARGLIIEMQVALEDKARELGALAPYERLAD